MPSIYENGRLCSFCGPNCYDGGVYGGVYQNAYTQASDAEPSRKHNAFHHYVGGGIKIVNCVSFSHILAKSTHYLLLPVLFFSNKGG